MMRRVAGITLVAGVLGMTTVASAASPFPATESVLIDVTLRDDGNDVVQSDAAASGAPSYTGNDVNSWIANFVEDDPDAPGDFWRVHLPKKRDISIWHPALGSEPTSCITGTWGPTGVTFRSHSTPQWFEGLKDQGTATGTTRILCQLDKKGQSFVGIRYPGTADDGGEGECVRASLLSTDPVGVRFTADPFVPATPGDAGLPPLIPATEPTPASGCPATIVELDRDFNETNILAEDTSAPFEFTATEKPARGK